MYNRTIRKKKIIWEDIEEFHILWSTPDLPWELRPYLFTIILNEQINNIQEETTWCMLLADDIVSTVKTRKEVTKNLEWLEGSKILG